MLNEDDILKSLFCLSPYIVGGSPVTEQNTNASV